MSGVITQRLYRESFYKRISSAFCRCLWALCLTHHILCVRFVSVPLSMNVYHVGQRAMNFCNAVQRRSSALLLIQHSPPSRGQLVPRTSAVGPAPGNRASGPTGASGAHRSVPRSLQRASSTPTHPRQLPACCSPLTQVRTRRPSCHDPLRTHVDSRIDQRLHTHAIKTQGERESVCV